jgi:hypothetical protein
MSWWRLLDAFGLAFLGFLYGAVVGLLAFLPCGGGHGWCLAMVAGWGALPLAVFGVALTLRGRVVGRVLLAIVVVWLLGIDAELVSTVREDGSGYLGNVWRTGGGLAYWSVWLLMWLACQIHVLWVVVREIGAGLGSLPRRLDLK